MTKSKTALLSLFIFFSPISFAEAIKTDWLTENDKLAFVDTESGIEWLKLSESKGVRYNDALSLFPGWRFPTESEMNTMFFNIFNLIDPGTSTDRLTVPTETAKLWVDLFGKTESNRSSGFFKKDNGELYQAGYYSGNTMFMDYTNPSYSQYSTEKFSYIGHFLVSDGGTTLSSKNNPNINNPTSDIPVSYSFSFLILSFFALKKRKHHNVT